MQRDLRPGNKPMALTATSRVIHHTECLVHCNHWSQLIVTVTDTNLGLNVNYLFNPAPQGGAHRT